MFNGLSNDNDKRREAFVPDSVVTISGGELLYKGPTASHAFGRLSGEIVSVDVEEDARRICVNLIAPSGMKVQMALPDEGGQTLRVLLPLATVGRFSGRTMNIDVAPEMKDGEVRAAIKVYDGNRPLEWKLLKNDRPATKEGWLALARKIARDIQGVIEKEWSDRAIPRVAPDIDDVPEGL